MIPVEKIFEGIIDQAKEGSCKTCRWCAKQWPIPGSEGRILTHLCVIQGNLEPIDFEQSDLDFHNYPWITKYGDWRGTGPQGHVEVCLAYCPGYDGTMMTDSELDKAADKHRDFIRNLSCALSLHDAIKDNNLAKLTAKLNEAKESLPVGLKEAKGKENDAGCTGELQPKIKGFLEALIL